MMPLRCAVVGVGYLGRFHAQKYKNLESEGLCKLVAVCDPDAVRAQQVADELGVPFVVDFNELMSRVDAVSVAASTSVHHAVTKRFLENGVHVLVEKPIASTSAEAEELVNLSESSSLVLQVGHIERFSPVFEKVREVLTGPMALDFQRMAPYGPRSNSSVDVVVDLMIHDLDLALCLDPSPVRTVSAWGWKFCTKVNDLAMAHINFESGMVATFTASRVAPALVRRLHGVQEGVSVFADFGQLKFESSRSEGARPPQLEALSFEKADSLLEEIRSFLNSINRSQKALVNGRAGTEALRLAEKILETIHSSRA